MGIIILARLIKSLPSVKDLENPKWDVSTKIYDRNGILLFKIYKNQNRSPISLADVPESAKKATLAAEDSEFYNHPGFSIKGIIRSILTNLKDGQMTGGSTITQQLVKNALLTPEKTLTRKIKELILSAQVELTYSKDQIFEMYLNQVSYGGTAYGIKEGSLQYFGKVPKDLTLAESAVLAGLPKNPTLLSPFGTNQDYALQRGRQILDEMLIKKMISVEDYQKAIAEKITFAKNSIDIKAPHFVMYIKDQLVKEYGQEMVERGGLEVTTTLDYAVQQQAQDTVKNELAKIAGLHVKNGAAVVLNPQTGEVLAMVGSKDYFDSTIDGNVNLVTSLRPPGSSIKVINYAYALGHGMTPATIIDDSPVSFVVAGQPPYVPKNYDDKFRGKITLRSALAESRNIPAVKVLASFGVDKMINLGREMGITTWNDPSRFGLSLTLGGGEVKLIDLAQVYATVANAGKRPDIRTIIKVTDYRGNVLQADPCINKDHLGVCNPAKQVLDPRVAFMLTDILKDNKARTPAFGSYSALFIPDHSEIAVKTGTSNDTKDNLTVGYTKNLLVAVWVGNNDNSPMGRIASGITGAAPIWHGIMDYLLSINKDEAWSPPNGLVQRDICTYTGTLPCSGCPTAKEWFPEENQPQKTCILLKTAEDNQDDSKKSKKGKIDSFIVQSQLDRIFP